MATVDIEAPGASETALKDALQDLMKPPVGCRAYVGTDLTTQDISADLTPIALNTESYDDAAIHDTGSNTDRFTIPAGYTWAEFVGQVYVTLIGNTGYIYAGISHYNSSNVFQAHIARQSGHQEHGVANINVATGRIAVTAGEIYKLTATVLTDTSVTIKATETWLAVKLWP